MYKQLKKLTLSFLSISATMFNAVVRELADIALPLSILAGSL